MLLMIDLLQKCIRGLFVSLFKISGFCRLIAIGRNVTILGKKKDLIVGKRVKIEDGVFLQTVSEHGVHLGNNVTICHGAEIRPSGFYGGNLGWGLKVGDYSSIGSNSYIGCSGKIVIGNNVMIGANAFVTKDFSDDVVLMGTPAEIKKQSGNIYSRESG